MTKMWKAYSTSYLKNNRSAGVSVMIAAFISALLLSLLCGVFYNAWKYEVERLELEEGGWHSRLIGELAPEDIEAIRSFAHIKDVVIIEKGDSRTGPAVELVFSDRRAVFSDTPRIARQVGLPQESIAYHYALLAMYLVRDASDTAPRLIFPMFILITLAASLSLVVIIHNSFAVSMNARIHQFGILSSIGATPRQIRTSLLQEAAALCALPVLAGNLLGIAGSAGLLQIVNAVLGDGIAGRHTSTFGYSPLVLALTWGVTVITVWVSAWIPARKLSRLTPLEAMQNTGDFQLKRKKRSYLLARLFGVEGELAGNALKAQKKALRTSSLSFVFSFLAFSLTLCFFTLSGISTRETYFERYQNIWDIMVTVKDTDIDRFDKAEAVQKLDGVESAIVYQKASAKRIMTEEEMSEDMKAFGGFSHASGSDVAQEEGGFLVNAPVVILDDQSFCAYCEQLGITPRLDGAVMLNQIRDVTNPDFRHPVLMPYIKSEAAASVLRPSDGEGMTAEIPVLCYTDEVPALREEYATTDYYELVHFLPASLWKEVKGWLGGAEEDLLICVKGRKDVTLEELIAMQGEMERLLGEKYEIEFENRIQEYEMNDRQIQGMMAFFGGFCVLLAIIGIGNVFSNALGFVRQRRREFARYMSVGLTPMELKTMFCIEALVIAGRPVLISLPLVVCAIGFMLKASYMEIGVFMAEAPYAPILLFMLAISGAVALAYYLAWRNVRKISLAEVLRDDTMM